MENKEIYIDGVDVSGCDFLSKEDDYCPYSGEYRAYKEQCGCSDEEMCKDHPNCFYKKALNQLKRKEQECEELKEQLERKEENYQKLLSKSNKYIHNLVDENIQDISNLARQLDQLKKYIAEIKEIAEPYNDMSGNCVIVNVFKDMYKILQKISECEGNNDMENN